MYILSVSAITIAPDRQRREFTPDAISQLADSIVRTGLLHPIVIRDGNVLVAGERRLKALELLALQGLDYFHDGSHLPADEVPVVRLGDLSPLAAEEAELEENLRRVNLTWQEEERALARIHALRKAQTEGEQTRAQTGAELFPEMVRGAAGTRITNAERLTAAMATDPDIANARSREEALKVLRKKDDIKERTALSAASAATPLDERHTVVLGECRSWLSSCPSDHFDCIITDPPYGMGADAFGDAAGRLTGTEHVYDDSWGATAALLRAVIPELYRVGKPQHHLYLWCDLDGFAWLREECTKAGYFVHRTPLINIKREGGRVPWPEHGPRRHYEICLYATAGKGAKGLTGAKKVTAIYPDILESSLSEGNFGHGAQKPVEAYVNLLKRSVRPGDSVLDCFAGTGPLLVAAEELQLKSTLVEVAPHAHGIILERLAALRSPK